MANNNVLFKEFEHKGWERVADKYEDFWSSLTKKFINPLLKTLRLQPGMQLLDLACGPGYVSETAKESGAIPLGVDFSPQMIRIAKERNPEMEFNEGDAENLNFEPGSFDAVAMNFGMLHMADPEKVFFEAHRILKKGGRFGFTVWSKPEENTAIKIVEDAINAFANLNIDLPDGPSPFHFCNLIECKKIFEKTGFDISSFTFSTETVSWQVPYASYLFEAELNGGVRTAALLAHQSKSTLDKIRNRIEKEVENLKSGNYYYLPFSAHIISSAVR